MAALVGRDRLAQRGDAGQRRVLVVAFVQRGRGGVEDSRRPVLVREALTEVDRPGPLGQVGYLGEDCGADRSSFSSRLSTLPVALRGSSSRKTISRGTL